MIPKQVTKLRQAAFLKGRQSFEILESDLRVTVQQMGNAREFSMPLWQVDPEPERIKYRQGGSLVGAVLFGLSSLGIIVGMFFAADWGVVAALGFPLFLVGGFFFACFWRLRTHSLDARVFSVRSGGQVNIWFNNPDPGEFEGFCDALKQRALAAWDKRPNSSSPNSLAGEISELKKLEVSGVISKEDFEKAKSKLIEAAHERKIGFGS